MGRKILLTGIPKSGKSTILSRFIESHSRSRGMLAREVLVDGNRVGFEAITSHGEVAKLASTTHVSDISVGKYYVHIQDFEGLVPALRNYRPDELLYLDEIGQMQLHPRAFEDLIRTYLDAENDFIGTMSAVYDHPLIDELREHQGIEILTVTPETREATMELLEKAMRRFV